MSTGTNKFDYPGKFQGVERGVHARSAETGAARQLARCYRGVSQDESPQKAHVRLGTKDLI
ncbi:MAG: hypothetical protein ABI338_02570 [Gemmatimonadaceae bacterium]